MEASTISLTTSQQIEDHAKEQLNKHRQLKENAHYSLINSELDQVNPLSCLIFFIIKKKHLQSFIPDYELYTCKQLFSSNPCHESYFGLARLLSFEGKFHQAVDLLKTAIQINNDPIYAIWRYVLTVKTKNKNFNEITPSSYIKSFFCCSVERKEMGIIEKLETIPDSVEKFWAFMKLSLRSFAEIPHPQYFATKIKEIDTYFGYLAWVEVILSKNE